MSGRNLLFLTRKYLTRESFCIYNIILYSNRYKLHLVPRMK